MKTLVLLLAVVAFVVAQQAVTTDAVIKVRAVEHGDAIIPCGQSKIFLDGPDAFISWVKDDRRVVYRFPIDNSNTDEKSFNEVCYRTPDIKPCRDRTSLFLPHVTKDDAGFYRCRIHYNGSPAIDFDYHLVVVESPSHPKVYLENGTVESAIGQDYIGPIPLGTNITLICEVIDSDESSMVQWERNGHRVAGSELVQPGVHRALLELREMQRDENGARYFCTAQPADVTMPLRKGVEVKMYLPPLSIKIDLNEKYDFEAGTPRVIDCIIIGFIPTPTVEWYLNDKLLKPDTHKEIPGNNVTVSTLTLVTKRSDQNRILSCRAKNEYFTEVFSTSVRLHVGFKPICVVKSKHIIEVKPRIVEKVVCIVDSDPPPIAFTWTFSNAKTVATPVQGTEIPTRFKSILSWIPHVDEIGKLNCTATNYFGKQEEPCQFDIVRPDCTDERGAKVPCKRGLSYLKKKKNGEAMLSDAKIVVDVDENIDENGNHSEDVKVKNKQGRSGYVPIEYSEGSHVIETLVKNIDDNDGTPWWVPLSLFLLGSLFLVGVISYAFGHWILIQCKDREARNGRIPMTHSSDRAGRTSPTSQQGLGSYHREPDVIERFPHQTNITITPTSFATPRRNAPNYGDPSIYPICNETHTYCV